MLWVRENNEDEKSITDTDQSIKRRLSLSIDKHLNPSQIPANY